MITVNSYNDFIEKASTDERAFLLLYKSESEQGRCAYKRLETAAESKDVVPVYVADVNRVHDIHEKYNIDSVPSLLVFRSGIYENTVKGCHDRNYYQALLENTVFQVKGPVAEKTARQVTVYSTPTCSWCNTLKSWLQKNNIRYTDIDVSRDQKAAEALIRRSGQQGVPQTDIDGRIVVGFNQPLLKELLEIQ
jgi:glutaredoxin-like YruB-family protein